MHYGKGFHLDTTLIAARDRLSIGRSQIHQKLTLKQLSERSGVALSKMELAQVSVSYEKLAAAARALGVDIAQLFTQALASSAQVQPIVVSTAIADAPATAPVTTTTTPWPVSFPGAA